MTTTGVTAPRQGRAARVGSWFACHPVEIVFALLVAVAFAYSVRLTRSSFFFADDWLLIRQAGSARGLLRPYNEHLSILILGDYRVLAQLFGFVYTPFRVVGLVGFFAVPSGFFLTTRRQFGSPLAALMALPLLWYGKDMSLSPGALNHWLAVLGGIGCAAALNRGRRADWALMAALAFSLCSAGGGIAVAGACIVHNVCTRPALRRWVAVLVPTLLWVAWWLIAVGPTSKTGSKSLTMSQTLRFVRDLGYSPFDGAALGVSAVAVALLVAFAGYAVWTVSKGLRAGANVLAWSFGLVFWAVGLANSRGGLAAVTPFRYRYTALVLVLLAVVPRRPIVWPARFPITANRRRLLEAALVVLVLGSARGLVVRHDWQSSAALDGRIGRVTRAEALVVGLGPSVIPDATVMPFELGALRAGELRALLDDYDNPFPASPATADQRLVAMDAVMTQADGTRHAVACKPLRRPFAYQPVGLSVQFLWSPRTAFTIEVRRFGRQWVRVDAGRPGEALRLVLPRLGAGRPWLVRANGACRVGPRG